MTPTSEPTWAWRASTRRAATSKPEVSKIWLPMWECRPSSSRPGAATTRRTASRASPEVIEKPNFWSSWAVAMYSWVWASTPAVTRTITGWVRPRLAVTRSSRSISSKESTMTRPTPSATARRSSGSVLVLPW